MIAEPGRVTSLPTGHHAKVVSDEAVVAVAGTVRAYAE
jgi:hypothetical protein